MCVSHLRRKTISPEQYDHWEALKKTEQELKQDR